ncbi:MAG: DUF4878 domain-containing protein [Chloroflexi bacterium]|nr:DUF4878 domain-containing protein [Chloroflexota bacterium]
MTTTNVESSAGVAQPAARPDGGRDWFLYAIVGGVLLLVLLGLGTVLAGERPEEYVSGDAPADVVRNYYVAIQRGDLSRAYDYLSASTRAQTKYEEFVQRTGYRGTSRAPRARLRVEDTKIEGDTATVSVVVTRASRGGPFGMFGSDEWSNSRAIVLRRESGQWRISDPSEPYGLFYW